MIKKTSLCLILIFVFFLIPYDALATFEFFDGKLRIRGRLEQYMVYLTKYPDSEKFYRKTGWALNQSIFAFEALSTLVDNGDWLINLQSYFRYYYDSAPNIDSRLSRAFSTKRRLHQKYQRNAYDTDDWINELYLDMYKGPLNIRLGKQVVVWSEVEMVQTIDKINAIDLRSATPGIQPFDELKLSLWMFRGFYNSDLPGNLIFEHIFIPGDFERSRIPFEGTWLASKPAPGNLANRPGQGDAIYWMMAQASPKFTLSNYQYAFRVRGNSEFFMFNTPYIVDWTVSYWNGLDTGHATFTETEKFNEILGKNATGRLAGNPNPIPYGRDLAEWKRYEALGASFQTYVPQIGGVLRGELSYEIGRKWNRIDPKTAVRRVGNLGDFEPGNVERDFLSYGITADRPMCVPFYGDRMQRWGVRPCWDATLGVFGGYFMQNNSRIWQWSNGYDYRSRTFITFSLRGGFRHNEFIPIIRALYGTRNFGYVSPGVVYMPTTNIRVQLGYLYFYAKNPEAHRQAAVENRDMAYLRLRYEY